VLIYYIPQEKFVLIENKLKLGQLISLCPPETVEIYNKLSKSLLGLDKQVSLNDNYYIRYKVKYMINILQIEFYSNFIA
jgi:hypothetical protein